MIDIKIIVAKDTNDIIGRRNALPWSLPADTARFKEITYGHPVIMGRNTYESIGHPLPGGTNIVITSKEIKIKGVTVVHSLEDALFFAEGEDSEVFIIGGEMVYNEALLVASHLYITEVYVEILDGDASFPEIEKIQWREVERKFIPVDNENIYDMDFVVYHRIR